jgi:hypothetical protein
MFTPTHWHYGWRSNKHTNTSRHTCRIYVFAEMPNQTLLCIAATSEGAFTISSTKKKQPEIPPGEISAPVGLNALPGYGGEGGGQKKKKRARKTTVTKSSSKTPRGTKKSKKNTNSASSASAALSAISSAMDNSSSMGLFGLRGSSDEYDQKMHPHNTGTEGISEGTVIENLSSFMVVVVFF